MELFILIFQIEITPDTVGTGGDSHTRFPIGISFPAGSGLVAFGAALGVIPLDMPESEYWLKIFR